MNDQDTGSNLHIDADWKQQAQAEKQRLAEEARKAKAAASQAGPAGPAGGGGGQATAGATQAAAGATQAGGQAGQQREMPPANFQTLVSTLVTQAMFALGMVPDPQTGRRQASPDMARHHVDMLGVIEEKTQGNLDDEEAKMLASSLYELRMNYVDLCKQVMRQQTGQDEPAQGGGGRGGQSGQSGSGNPIITG